MISEYHALHARTEEQIALMYEILNKWAAGREMTDKDKQSYAGRKMGLDILAAGWNAAEAHIHDLEARITALEAAHRQLQKQLTEKPTPEEDYARKFRLLLKKWTHVPVGKTEWQRHDVLLDHPSHQEANEALRRKSLARAQATWPEMY